MHRNKGKCSPGDMREKTSESMRTPSWPSSEMEDGSAKKAKSPSTKNGLRLLVFEKQFTFALWSMIMPMILAFQSKACEVLKFSSSLPLLSKLRWSGDPVTSSRLLDKRTYTLDFIIQRNVPLLSAIKKELSRTAYNSNCIVAVLYSVNRNLI